MTLVLLGQEEVVDICALGSNDYRLSVHAEPSIRIQILGVDCVVNLAHNLVSTGVGIEYNLGSVKALFVELVEYLHELNGIGQIRITVGNVKVQKVDIDVAKKLCVLSLYPRVVCIIISV